MNKIAILVDSTSALTQDEAKKYDNLFMIPLEVIFTSEDTYLDGETITIKEFFEKCEEYYQKDGTLPTTSQPSIGRCIEKYNEILKDFDEIIYYTISEKMSGTYQGGKLASEEFDGKVTVVNSENTAATLLYSALKAAELAKKDYTSKEIVEKVEELYKNTITTFVVSDLKHLQRTGRIGAAASVIGNALQLKPVLNIADGEVAAVEKVRNINKAHKKVLESMSNYDITTDDVVCIVNGDADEYAKKFYDYMKENYEGVEIVPTDLSPVIGLNTGPGIVGVIIIKGYNSIK